MVADLLVSPSRGGTASNPVGCCKEGARVVFSLAGFRTFIPLPRPALWYPDVELVDDTISARPPLVESLLQEPQILVLSGLVDVSVVVPLVRVSIGLWLSFVTLLLSVFSTLLCWLGKHLPSSTPEVEDGGGVDALVTGL